MPSSHQNKRHRSASMPHYMARRQLFVISRSSWDCTIHQPPFHIYVASEHDPCTNCNSQHSLQSSRVAAILVQLLEGLCCFLVPLCSGLGFIHFICARNDVHFRIQEPKHLRVDRIALLSSGKEAHWSQFGFLQLQLSVFFLDRDINNSVLQCSRDFICDETLPHRIEQRRVPTITFLSFIDGELVIDHTYFPNVYCRGASKFVQ